jgi:hypothetical protein
MSATKGILDKIENLDVRIIYILVIICIAIPIAYPLGLPIEVSGSTLSAHNFIEQLPEGSVVLVGFETGAAGWPELGPQLNAYTQHLFDRNMKILIVSGNVDGAMLAEMYTIPKIVETGKVYGEDWVNLGYIAGGESGIAAFASQITSVTPRDYFGTPLESIEMMKNIKSAADFKLAIVCSWGTPGEAEYLRQYTTKFGVPLIVGAQVVSVPGLVPYYQSGQVVGYTAGLRGAGEYEILIGRPGYAVSSLDAASSYHLIVFVLIMIGNIAMVAKRLGTPKKEVS